jgi:hypothetical protein
MQLVVICAFTVICRDSTKYIPSARPDSKYVETRDYTILEYGDWVWLCLSMTEITAYEVDRSTMIDGYQNLSAKAR